MFYVPSNFINENNYYSYIANHDTLIVYQNCVNNSCDCNDIYIDYDYNYSQTYNCTLTHDSLLNGVPTDNYYYRKDFWIILFIFLVFCFVILYVPIKIFLRFFKRFN